MKCPVVYLNNFLEQKGILEYKEKIVYYSTLTYSKMI